MNYQKLTTIRARRGVSHPASTQAQQAQATVHLMQRQQLVEQVRHERLHRLQQNHLELVKKQLALEARRTEAAEELAHQAKLIAEELVTLTGCLVTLRELALEAQAHG